MAGGASGGLGVILCLPVAGHGERRRRENSFVFVLTVNKL